MDGGAEGYGETGHFGTHAALLGLGEGDGDGGGGRGGAESGDVGG